MSTGEGGTTTSPPMTTPTMSTSTPTSPTTSDSPTTTPPAATPATATPSAPTGAQANAYRWGNVAMGGGGYVTAVIPSRTEQGLFYARTDVGGAYRWDKTSGRWLPLLDSLSENDVGLMGAESIALDPRNSAVLYVLAGTSYFSGGKTAVMRSTDYGATFSRVTDVTAQFHVNGNGMGRGNGEKMQVDPGNSSVLYVGSRDNGLLKSTDAGATFTRVSSLPVTTTPSEVGVSFVMLDPSSVSGGRAQHRGAWHRVWSIGDAMM